MAKMGTRGLSRKRETDTDQLSSAGFLGAPPANWVAGPIGSAPVIARYVGVDCPLGISIMREGFTTYTGLLLSGSAIKSL